MKIYHFRMILKNIFAKYIQQMEKLVKKREKIIKKHQAVKLRMEKNLLRMYLKFIVWNNHSISVCEKKNE